jgi:hypothetical protein
MNYREIYNIGYNIKKLTLELYAGKCSELDKKEEILSEMDRLRILLHEIKEGE